jgi:hypothetical protein
MNRRPSDQTPMRSTRTHEHLTRTRPRDTARAATPWPLRTCLRPLAPCAAASHRAALGTWANMLGTAFPPFRGTARALHRGRYCSRPNQNPKPKRTGASSTSDKQNPTIRSPAGSGPLHQLRRRPLPRSRPYHHFPPINSQCLRPAAPGAHLRPHHAIEYFHHAGRTAPHPPTVAPPFAGGLPVPPTLIPTTRSTHAEPTANSNRPGTPSRKDPELLATPIASHSRTPNLGQTRTSDK